MGRIDPHSFSAHISFENEKVELVEINDRYFDFIAECHKDLETQKFTVTSGMQSNMDIRLWYEADYKRQSFGLSRNQKFYIIKEEEKNEGYLSVNFLQTDRIELGIVLHPTSRKKGIATKVLREICRYSFMNGTRKIIARIIPENSVSLHMMYKLGFQKEGVLREEQMLGSHYRDLVQVSLLKGELQ